MTLRLKTSMAMLLACLVTAPALAETVCTLEKPTLKCGENRTEILDAMANPQTLAMLQGLRAPAAPYVDGHEREAFRRSLEANRKAAQKHADRAFRNYRRKRISADDYEAVRTKFESAMKTYETGMNIYRDATWYSPVKPYQAD